MQPSYKLEFNENEDININMQADDEEIEDNILNGEDDDENSNFLSNIDKIANDNIIEKEGPMISKVNQAEWNLELERVLPKLKSKINSEGREWRSHLEQTKKHSALLVQYLPDTRNSLSQLNDNLSKLVDRISIKEKSISRDFQHLSEEYMVKKQELDSLLNLYEDFNQSIREMSNELSIKVEESENMKAQMADKNSSMTDTSPIRLIKLALQNLKNEMKQMEIQLGVASQSLLQEKLKESQDGSIKKSSD